MRKLAVLVLLLVVMGFASAAYAGTKPVANMPDYNGTYYGTPNTGGDCDSASANCDSTAGRMMFTTLYRDNYNRDSGCAGERCGSHAGVDIAVVSGTPVRAALAGKIVNTGCKEGPGTGDFGGTIVIEANNPYVAGNKVYLVYAHLDDWNDYAVGSQVSQGAVIGLSGGKLKSQGGICPGGSQGAHLHFQVDKNLPDANGRPWFPPNGAKQADTNFDVPKYTHNPLPFVTGFAYNFTFAENNNRELWGAVNVNGYNTANSDLWIDSSSSIPYAGRSSFFAETTCATSSGKPCSREITLDADIFKRLVFTLDFKCYNNPVTIYFMGPDNVWHGGTFNYSAAGTYTLPMTTGSSYWRGIITDLLIQPSRGCTASPGPNEYFIKQMYALP